MQDQYQESKNARYRRLARECLEIAKKVQTEEVRRSLIEMAWVWGYLAEESERTTNHRLSSVSFANSFQSSAIASNDERCSSNSSR